MNIHNSSINKTKLHKNAKLKKHQIATAVERSADYTLSAFFSIARICSCCYKSLDVMVDGHISPKLFYQPGLIERPRYPLFFVGYKFWQWIHGIGHETEAPLGKTETWLEGFQSWSREIWIRSDAFKAIGSGLLRSILEIVSAKAFE